MSNFVADGSDRVGTERGKITSHAVAALVILTSLNFVNYIDRSVLFAVQPLIQFTLTNGVPDRKRPFSRSST